MELKPKTVDICGKMGPIYSFSSGQEASEVALAEMPKWLDYTIVDLDLTQGGKF